MRALSILDLFYLYVIDSEKLNYLFTSSEKSDTNEF